MSKLEEKTGLKAGQAIALIVIAVLNILWVVCFLTRPRSQLSINFFLSLILFAASVLYALFAYKKPHGNFMRYLLLAYDAIGSVMFVLMCTNQELYLNITNVVMIFLTAYMAGRLDHYRQNVVICGINLVGTIIVSVSPIIKLSQAGRLNFVTFFCSIAAITCWLAVAASYIIRYKAHKEAGLADK